MGWRKNQIPPLLMAQVRAVVAAAVAREREGVQAAQPLFYVSPKQVPTALTPNGEAPYYVPYRLTPEGLFTMPVYGPRNLPEVGDAVDSMGVPKSCGGPLCCSGWHHPLCGLADVQ